MAIRGVKATCTQVVLARGFKLKIDVSHGIAFEVRDGSMILNHFAEQLQVAFANDECKRKKS